MLIQFYSQNIMKREKEREREREREKTKEKVSVRRTDRQRERKKLCSSHDPPGATCMCVFLSESLINRKNKRSSDF